MAGRSVNSRYVIQQFYPVGWTSTTSQESKKKDLEDKGFWEAFGAWGVVMFWARRVWFDLVAPPATTGLLVRTKRPRQGREPMIKSWGFMIKPF